MGNSLDAQRQAGADYVRSQKHEGWQIIDQHYDDVIVELCQAVIDEGKYEGVTAETAAEALTSMTNGLWLSALISPQIWDRDLALEAVHSYLRSVFPKHFSQAK